MPDTCELHEGLRRDIAEACKAAALTAAAVDRMEALNARFHALLMARTEATEKAMSHWRWWTGGVASSVTVGVVALGLAARFGWFH
jgi:hypothetical protein